MLELMSDRAQGRNSMAMYQLNIRVKKVRSNGDSEKFPIVQKSLSRAKVFLTGSSITHCKLPIRTKKSKEVQENPNSLSLVFLGLAWAGFGLACRRFLVSRRMVASGRTRSPSTAPAGAPEASSATGSVKPSSAHTRPARRRWLSACLRRACGPGPSRAPGLRST
jgi:hypothetical protein